MDPTTLASGQPGVLPGAVKIAQPSSFDGTMSRDALDAFFFWVERYLDLTGVIGGTVQANFLSMLLTSHAAVWLQGQAYDWT